MKIVSTPAWISWKPASTRLESRFDQLEARFTNLELRVDKLEARLDRLKDLFEDLSAQVNARVEEVDSRIERLETSLLTEFHKWARTYEVRVRGATVVIAEYGEPLGLVEERLSDLERKFREKHPPSSFSN